MLLTDTGGVFTADPRHDAEASLIEEIVEVDEALEEGGGRRGDRARQRRHGEQARGREDRGVVGRARGHRVGGRSRTSSPTRSRAARSARRSRRGPTRLSSRKLWIAFAQGSDGRVTVDAGARRALVDGGKSLLAAGVRDVDGAFDVDAPVEIVGDDGRVFAKGLCRYGASQLRAVAGKRTADLPTGSPQEVVHRDDLVVLP